MKLAGTAMVPALVALSWFSGVIFSSWKKARLAPIFKKDDETDIGKYRPVSLLSVPGKIMESELYSTLVRHIFKSNNLSGHIVPGIRPNPCWYTLHGVVEESCGLSNAVAAAFGNFKKAFDSVHHDILLKKLNCELGVKGSLLDLIFNYLSGRQQFTVLNGVNGFFYLYRWESHKDWF